MRRGLVIFWIGLVVVAEAGLVPPLGRAQGSGAPPSWMHIRPVKIPDADSTSGILDGWLVYGEGGGQRPLALIGLTDGEAQSGAADVGPGIMLPEAEWFARRGWAVGIVLRRGYGAGGKFPHVGIIKCGTQDMEEYSEYYTKDLRVALAYYTSQPEVDRSRAIALANTDVWGHTIWLADGAPSSLKAVITFGSHGLFDTVLYREKCLQGSILPALRRVGGSSHVPMLWVFGKMKTSGETSTKECLDAVTGAGGSVEFEAAKNYDLTNASYLFAMDESEWGPIVESFLMKQRLPAEPVFAAPEVADIKLPKDTLNAVQSAFEDYLRRGPSKAFAMGPNGAWAYRFGRSSRKIAEKEVLDVCIRCVVVSSQGW